MSALEWLLKLIQPIRWGREPGRVRAREELFPDSEGKGLLRQYPSRSAEPMWFFLVCKSLPSGWPTTIKRPGRGCLARARGEVRSLRVGEEVKRPGLLGALALRLHLLAEMVFEGALCDVIRSHVPSSLWEVG